MRKRLLQAAIVFVVLFAAAQFVRPPHPSPPTDERRTIQAQLGATSPLVAVVDRSCGDCHSNRTASPWFARVAPASWLMASAVSKGRQAVNFSNWAAYPPSAQQALLSASCQAATNGTMPGPYATLRPDTRLSPGDIDTICAAASTADAETADRR